MTDSNQPQRSRITPEEALAYHLEPCPGKLEIVPSTPMATQRDLSLAYSPGVAVPVQAIAERPETAYDYTTKGNLVAVVSNRTAILGLGNLGALASKPVMEGKAVLFKRFADVNAIDIELDTEDPEEIIRAVRLMGPSFGGINLEDIKAPECFIIESRLKEMMDIPVFHDDQHGTAVICAAGLINALELSGKRIEDVKIVLNGAGAAGIACLELLKAMGARHENCIMADTKGVIWQGRTEGMNQWKSAHAVATEARTLADAMVSCDVFLGVSAKGAVTQEMVKSMAPNPVIFAMANPDPEITPEEAHAVRPDAIVATGRSDYPNQVNNVLGFPYIFRGALDVGASKINEEMKKAAVKAIAASCDAVLVIGAPNSSNSLRLVEVAEREGTPARLIQRAAELDWAFLDGVRTLGITAGASAPELLVRELVALGRYPWHGALGRFGPRDHQAVAAAMQECGVAPFADRLVDTLSGGERQRVWLAMMVAQQAGTLLLDEPISALDIAHQVEVLALIRRMCHEQTRSAVIVLHDVNMAARFCDHIVALKRGRLAMQGSPAELIRPDALHAIYGLPMQVLMKDDGTPVAVPA